MAFTMEEIKAVQRKQIKNMTKITITYFNVLRIFCRNRDHYRKSQLVLMQRSIDRVFSPNAYTYNTTSQGTR